MLDGKRARASLIPLVGLFAGVSAFGGDAVLLQLRSDSAPEAYAEFTAEASQTMTGPDGNPMKVSSKSVYGLLTTTTVGAEGVQIRATFDRLYGYLAFGEGIQSRYDTDDPEAEDASPDHKAAFALVLNQAVTMTFDPAGVGKIVEGGEAIRTKLNELGPQNFVAGSMARDELADRRMLSNFGESVLAIYPNREVRVGETWKVTQHDEYPSVGKVIQSFECALEKIEPSPDGDVAVVRFSGTVVKDAAEQPAEGKRLGKIDGTFTGVARYAVNLGQFVDVRADTTSKIEVPPWWSQDPTADLMKIDGQFKTSYVRMSAADRVSRKAEIARAVAAARAARQAEEAAAMAGPIDPVTPANDPEPWLQWGGPNRDFKSSATGLANRWPEQGPRKLWERPLGDGFSTILCDGETLYTMYSARDASDPFQGEEVIVALKAGSGETLWEHRYAAPWPRDLQMEFGPGPHSTPLIVGDRLFAVGCTAILNSLDKRTGKPIWSKDLHAEYKAALNMRGYGSSPLAHEGNIVLPVSSEKGHAVMAFAQSDGAVAWAGGEFEPGYASLFSIEAFGRPQLVAFTGKNVCGLEPGSAATLWSFDYPTQFGANISTPVWNSEDQQLFISAAYGMGSRGLRLEDSGGQIAAREAWSNNKFKIQHANAVRVGDWVYGSSGDFGPAFLCSVNSATGEFGWRQRGIAKATMLYADGKLIVLDEDGALFLVKADGKQYRLLAKAPDVLAKTAWTAPTLYGRTLYLRDRTNIVALDLSPAP